MAGVSLERAAYCPRKVEAATFDQFGQKATVFLEHSHSYPSRRFDWLGLAYDQGNGNTSVEHTSHSLRRGNREKPAAARMKSVSVSCACRVIDERAGPVPTILVARFSDIRSLHDENKVRTRVGVSRDFPCRAGRLAFRAYKRISLNGMELLAKELGAG